MSFFNFVHPSLRNWNWCGFKEVAKSFSLSIRLFSICSPFAVITFVVTGNFASSGELYKVDNLPLEIEISHRSTFLLFQDSIAVVYSLDERKNNHSNPCLCTSFDLMFRYLCTKLCAQPNLFCNLNVLREGKALTGLHSRWSRVHHEERFSREGDEGQKKKMLKLVTINKWRNNGVVPSTHTPPQNEIKYARVTVWTLLHV